ncbi:hypothetical protein Pelo_17691 [Pelomyxa schiedti]|nr:hypothetical protein Pelo_17691 [Pelomyxa schiedti]
MGNKFLKAYDTAVKEYFDPWTSFPQVMVALGDDDSCYTVAKLLIHTNEGKLSKSERMKSAFSSIIQTPVEEIHKFLVAPQSSNIQLEGKMLNLLNNMLPIRHASSSPTAAASDSFSPTKVFSGTVPTC